MALAPLNIPLSSATVGVSIIDTTTRIASLPLGAFVGPPMEGFETLTGVSYSFLITNKEDRSLLFDLGAPMNWETDLPPLAAASIEALADGGVQINIEAYTNDILTNHSIPLESIEAIVWSHTHWDHLGRPSFFPNSTDLIVGPGTLDYHGFGYPLNETSPFRARELEGRAVVEVQFPDDAAVIGGLQAHDYFGDGSFYLLNAPGHDIGHVNALARVTSNPDSFIFLGADSFHHNTQIRPTKDSPFPEFIDMFDPPASFPSPLPREFFYPLHPSNHPESLPPYASNLTAPDSTPYMAVSDDAAFSVDPPTARDVVNKIQAFDSDERVFVVSAHDTSLLQVVDFFPASANDWKAKGWKEQGRWQYLSDLENAIAAISPCHRRSHARHWS